MMWKRVIGQQHAKTTFIRAIKTGTIAHAYCLWGPEGIGKDALAVEFARVLNCLQPLQIEDSIDACDRCMSCQQMDRLHHPNIHFVFALPPSSRSGSDDDSPLHKLSDEQIGTIQEQLQMKALDPYHKITIPHATQIRIASIRELSRILQLSAQLDYGWKVVIISQAEMMTTEAANAFLKTMEEPHPQTTIILTTSRRDQILPTILSRCQQIHCCYLFRQEIADALVEKACVEPQQAHVIATLAQGSYSRALSIANSQHEFNAAAEASLTFLRLALKSPPYRVAFHEFVEELSHYSRSYLRMVLEILLTWLNDTYRIQQLGIHARPYSTFQSEEMQEVQQRFLDRYGLCNIDRTLYAVEQGIVALESNANSLLTLLVLGTRIRKALHTYTKQTHS